eukprot:gene10112-8013_t
MVMDTSTNNTRLQRFSARSAFCALNGLSALSAFKVVSALSGISALSAISAPCSIHSRPIPVPSLMYVVRLLSYASWEAFLWLLMSALFGGLLSQQADLSRSIRCI